jgi:hypothetical protein
LIGRKPAALESQVRSLDGGFRRFREPGAWLFVAIAAGAGMRIFLAFASEGTLDVEIWQAHAQTLTETPLIDYYHGGRFTFNHPPPMGLAARELYALAQATGLSFGFLLRFPFALLDAFTAILLFSALAEAKDRRLRRARYALASLYWVSPMAAIFSAYHGNTDSSVGFFLIAATLCLLRAKPGWAGAVLGFSLWIKIPGVLALPVLLLAMSNGRERWRFCTAMAATVLAGYLPWLVQDPTAVVRSVFFYSGLMIQTPVGVPIWGLQVFYPDPAELSPAAFDFFRRFRGGYYQWNTVIALTPVVLYALLRNRARNAESILAGIAGSYFIFYGLTNFWAFQYLAWALPLWAFLGFRIAGIAQTLTFFYIYGLYAWLCGDPFLLGKWDFIAKGDWPVGIRGIRDACVLFFFGAALYFLVGAAREAGARWRGGPGRLSSPRRGR